MKLVTVSEMIAIEREANDFGLTYENMMANAGRGLAEVVAEMYGYLADEGVLGLVGSGNNGGDTLVALTYLSEEGWPASAYTVRPRPADDELMIRLTQAGGAIYTLESDENFQDLERLLQGNAILLDGVLGTGIRLPLKGKVPEVLNFVTTTISQLDISPIIVAVDCPSGIDSDSGEAAPETLPADLTITMAAIKQGLLKFPAYNLVGELQVIGIGLPEAGEGLESWQKVQCLVPDASYIKNTLPYRSMEAHKGTFGTALIIAGSTSYTGAALLAGEAAYRIGAGLVTLAVPKPLHAALAGQLPECTWILLPHHEGSISADAGKVIEPYLDQATAISIGPGFGLKPTTEQFLTLLFGQTTKLPPLVVDADGLKLLARIPDWPNKLPPLTILTPHPGEMSIMTELSTKEIQSNRMDIARQYSTLWGHIVVLKGAFTVIAAPDGQTAVIPVASPALARAGTGDVLTGLIVGLRAQGVDPFHAAVSGAWIHAQAGLIAADLYGNTASVLAGDVLNAVIDVLSEVLNY